MAEFKGTLHKETLKNQWKWRKVLHLLFNHDHCDHSKKEHSADRKAYLRSLKWNIAHAVSYTLTIGALFVGTSYLLEFATTRLFGVVFNPVELLGWGYFIGWMVINAALHGFIDRRWPVKNKMIHMGQNGYFRLGGGAPAVDQAAHKVCLYLTTIAIPVVAALLK
jgi:hypothetical protein